MSIDIYDQNASTYTQYANGASDIDALISTPGETGHFAFGDQATWELIVEQLARLQLMGTNVRILDLGCGDGIWSLRLAEWLDSRGLSAEISLLDSSEAMLAVARDYVEAFCQRKPHARLSVTFHQADMQHAWCPEIQNKPWDLVLCLHTVVNHITGISRAAVYEHLFNLDAQTWVVSVKPPGGLKTLFAVPMSDIVASQQYQEEMLALDRKGQFHRVPGSPISAEELTEAFTKQGCKGTLHAIDVFTSRFQQATQSNTELPKALRKRLEALDRQVIYEPDVMNHANHILAVVNRE